MAYVFLLTLKGDVDMKSHYKLFWLTLVVSLLLLANTLAVAADKPSASLTIDETQVMALLGGSMGGGILRMGDQSYSFKTGGVKLGGVGVHKAHLVGDVYHLNDVKDFPGTYFEAQAGVTVVKGLGGKWLENDKGVTLHLRSSGEGLSLDTGAGGLKITME